MANLSTHEMIVDARAWLPNQTALTPRDLLTQIRDLAVYLLAPLVPPGNIPAIGTIYLTTQLIIDYGMPWLSAQEHLNPEQFLTQLRDGASLFLKALPGSAPVPVPAPAPTPPAPTPTPAPSTGKCLNAMTFVTRDKAVDVMGTFNANVPKIAGTWGMAAWMQPYVGQGSSPKQDAAVKQMVTTCDRMHAAAVKYGLGTLVAPFYVLNGGNDGDWVSFMIGASRGNLWGNGQLRGEWLGHMLCPFYAETMKPRNLVPGLILAVGDNLTEYNDPNNGKWQNMVKLMGQCYLDPSNGVFKKYGTPLHVWVGIEAEKMWDHGRLQSAINQTHAAFGPTVPVAVHISNTGLLSGITGLDYIAAQSNWYPSGSGVSPAALVAALKPFQAFGLPVNAAETNGNGPDDPSTVAQRAALLAAGFAVGC